ncbi:hypothetical protein B0H17DRAFT_550643 [Mycena rosella]|uniref:Uncharacterized protein n=1 Tax=Mycena rosella TaxID=1033263 RepID=A0AAD7GJE0_MYCRO|nr:hypothetical protein B0H17DRAFT_550643 [Mycena rosella]
MTRSESLHPKLLEGNMVRPTLARISLLVLHELVSLRARIHAQLRHSRLDQGLGGVIRNGWRGLDARFTRTSFRLDACLPLFLSPDALRLSRLFRLGPLLCFRLSGQSLFLPPLLFLFPRQLLGRLSSLLLRLLLCRLRLRLPHLLFSLLLCLALHLLFLPGRGHLHGEAAHHTRGGVLRDMEDDVRLRPGADAHVGGDLLGVEEMAPLLAAPVALHGQHRREAMRRGGIDHARRIACARAVHTERGGPRDDTGGQGVSREEHVGLHGGVAVVASSRVFDQVVERDEGRVGGGWHGHGDAERPGIVAAHVGGERDDRFLAERRVCVQQGLVCVGCVHRGVTGERPFPIRL